MRIQTLRTVRAAGAIAALGIFTGLAATGDRTGIPAANPTQTATSGTEGLDDTSGGFFDERARGSTGILPSSGGSPSTSSGGS